MPSLESLIRIMADGKFHSGESLGMQLGVTRSAIWKALSVPEARHFGIERVRGRGYRLWRCVELLKRDVIRSRLTPATRDRITSLEVLFEVDSTNRYLSRQSAAQPATTHAVCLAEMQHDGRGRRGRTWVSPFGANVYLSFLWCFSEGTARLSGLSLAVAVACVRALVNFGAKDALIKWPNDIWWDEKKLAGILIDVSGESNGPCNVVIGIGINIGMPAAAPIDQPWADLGRIVPGLSRNHVAAELVEQLVCALDEFSTRGMGAFSAEWERLDAIAGREVVLHFPNRSIYGNARGIDNDGALLVDTEQGRQRFVSGEISLRTVTS